jgi:hypothetical protein
MKGDITTLDFTVSCLSVGTYPPRDVVVPMHSMTSTCPQVGAICYPQLLGITKEMMSRGPKVAMIRIIFGTK